MHLPDAEAGQRVNNPAASLSKRRALAAALLSSIVPGSGHFLAGEMGKGCAFLTLLIVLILGALWLRIPREFKAATFNYAADQA
jgi:TM2 domain-containing membrane protein YozV